MQKDSEYPMRINKYLAARGYTTRLGADDLVRQKKVFVNGKAALLGQKVASTDRIEIRDARPRQYKYFAYNKPVDVRTEEIKVPGVFPIGRLDKNSYGLMLLTDDGRVTDRLLNPERAHDKEYLVRTADKLPSNIKRRMEGGVDIGGYVTKKCVVDRLNDFTFRIILTEGKKHQIRRMCDAFSLRIRDLKRTRILNIKLGDLAPGHKRELAGPELATFLNTIGL